MHPPCRALSKFILYRILRYRSIVPFHLGNSRNRKLFSCMARRNFALGYLQNSFWQRTRADGNFSRRDDVLFRLIWSTNANYASNTDYFCGFLNLVHTCSFSLQIFSLCSIVQILSFNILIIITHFLFPSRYNVSIN